MSKYTRAIAAIAVTVTAAAAAVPALSGAHAAGTGPQTLRLFDTPVATTLTTTSGQVTSRPPYPQPKPGDVLDVYSLDYAGNHLHHAARWTMSNHLRCAFGNRQPACESDVAVGGSLLVFNGSKLVGATGLYEGATGRVLSNTQVSGTDNASDIVVRIQR
jgi:hypothetical protein